MLKFKKMWKSINICKNTKRKIKEVNYKDINLNDYIIIDVRSKREFREKHLNGALNIPLSEIKKNIEKYIKDKNKKILVYCEYGTRSVRAVEFLETLEYTNVYNLKGGLENI